MAFLSRKQYSDVSYFRFSISECNDYVGAFRWFADAVTTKIDNILRIDLSDLASYHDGTQSVQLDSINSADEFVEKWSKRPFKKLSASFYHDSIYVVLKVDLKSFVVSLGCAKEDEAIAASLAVKLNLGQLQIDK